MKVNFLKYGAFLLKKEQSFEFTLSRLSKMKVNCYYKDIIILCYRIYVWFTAICIQYESFRLLQQWPYRQNKTENIIMFYLFIIMLTYPLQQNPSGQPSWLAVSKKTPQNQKNPKPLCDSELENPGFVTFWVVMICRFYHFIIANQYTQHRSHR